MGQAAAERASKLDPDLAEAHALLAELAFMADDPAELLDREVRRALQLNPNLAQAHSILSSLAGSFGIIESYILEAEEAYRLDPLSPPMIRRQGEAYFNSGRLEETLAHWKKHIESDPIERVQGAGGMLHAQGRLGPSRGIRPRSGASRTEQRPRPALSRVSRGTEGRSRHGGPDDC